MFESEPACQCEVVRLNGVRDQGLDPCPSRFEQFLLEAGALILVARVAARERPAERHPARSLHAEFLVRSAKLLARSILDPRHDLRSPRRITLSDGLRESGLDDLEYPRYLLRRPTSVERGLEIAEPASDDRPSGRDKRRSAPSGLVEPLEPARRT